MSLISKKEAFKSLSGFNGYPKVSCRLIRPEYYNNFLPQSPHCIARGCGSSYGDASINTTGIVVSTLQLNRFLAFDSQKGILVVEAGITLHEICQLIVPAGWFLPATPGSAFISLGGAIAADAHGKNHLKEGSLGEHIVWFELITATFERIRCTANENADLFWATIGGMGLTGFISTICIKLKRISSPFMMVENKKTINLSETLDILNDTSSRYEYNIAWLDGQANKNRWGKGIIMTGNHAAEESIRQKKKRSPSQFYLPFKPPINLINPFLIKTFNYFYYFAKAQKKNIQHMYYKDFFYPLDKIKNWPYLYGKKGFIQYQCVFPLSDAEAGIEKLLTLLQKEKILCSLIVLKRLGNPSEGLLSFPKEGITIAIDMPFSEKLLKILNRADEIVASHDGRVYLAKDARLSKDMFIKMYPNYFSWIKIKQKIDPENIFQSSLSLRLNLFYEKQ